MNEINLKLETKTVKCKKYRIKSNFIHEIGTPEIVIPKKIREEVEKLLIKELREKI